MASVNNFTSAVIRIRDILRKTAISGMESMRHICLYLMARQITRQTVLDLDVPIKFAWENIIEMMHTQEGGEQYALEFFYHPEEDCLVRHFDRLFGTEKFSFDIKNLKTHKEILEILDRIDLSMVDSQMDILGWVYEQHLKTGAGSGGRDLGQFFTDRTICEYMVSLCRPVFKRAGVPESVCDPSMGTGGFLTSFIKYYKKNHSDTPINWKIQQKEIHGCDNDPRVAGIARMNLFMETGGSRPTNLRTHDSLHGDLTQTGYDVILANEPFGLKGLKHADCCERVKQLKIRGTKSEPLFLQLMMVSLNQGGRCAVVVPDGMLVNTSELHDGTRKYLLDHFELKRVIKMRGQFFMNTGIQPSILFFENTGNPTAVVEFWDVEKSKSGEIKETMVLSIPRDQLDASCSLDMRRYQEAKEVENSAAFPTVKLGEMVTIESGKYITKKEAVSDGFPIYGGGDACDYYSTTSNRSNRLVIAKDGVSLKCVRWVSGDFHLNHHGWTLQCNDSILEKYLYYYLSMKQPQIYSMATGSAQKGINQKTMEQFEVIVPPLPIQQEIVATLDRIYQPGTTELAETLRGANQAMDVVLAQANGATLESHRLMRKSSQMVADVNTQMMADINAQMVAIVKSVESRRFPMVKLGDIAVHENGKTLSSAEKLEGGEYDVMGGGMTYNGKTNKYNRDGNTISVSKSGASAGFVAFHSQKYWAGDCLTLVPNDTTCNIRYLYYYMKLNSHLTMSTTSGSTIPHCKWDDIKGIPIPLPPLTFQHAVITRLDALQSQLTALENLIRQAEDNARFILESYLQSPIESSCSAEEVWNNHDATLVNEIVEAAASATRPLKMKKPGVSKK